MGCPNSLQPKDTFVENCKRQCLDGEARDLGRCAEESAEDRPTCTITAEQKALPCLNECDLK